MTQAAGNVPTLTAWHPRRIVTSTATRCVTTVAPLAAATGIDMKRTDKLSQDAWEDGTGDVRSVIGKRIRSRKTAVLCSHGPVLPDILREIALATGSLPGSYRGDAAHLPPGGYSVVHLSADRLASFDAGRPQRPDGIRSSICRLRASSSRSAAVLLVVI